MHSAAGLLLLRAPHGTSVPVPPHPSWIYEGNNQFCTFIPSLCLGLAEIREASAGGRRWARPCGDPAPGTAE